MVQFENTPQAFANFSSGFERKREPWVIKIKICLTLKGLGGRRTLTGFHTVGFTNPRVVAAPTLG